MWKRSEGVDPLIWAWHMYHGWSFAYSNADMPKSVPSLCSQSDLNILMSLAILAG